MTCDELQDVIERVAEGDGVADSAVTVHLASCARCAAALEEARTLEKLLRARPAPKPPPQFTARTLARVRRSRWRSEQVFDAGFNAALALLAAAVAGGIWLLLNRTGLVAVSNDAVALVGRGMMTLVRRIAPSLPLYAAATALLGSALAVWWWAERDERIW